MKKGQYLGASCPYGYRKDPRDHNHLVVDDYAADVVRKIYRLYLKGYGKAKIGKILTEEGILIPTRYKREVLGVNYRNSHETEHTRSWSYQTIHGILNNEVYIGNVVQNRYRNLSYKDKRHVKQPEDQWIRVTGMHEAIIDTDTFLKVQERQKIRTKAIHTEGAASLFSGILFCADCRYAMVRTYERRGAHRFTGYCCKIYKTQGKKACKSHAVNYDQLKETVLHAIQSEARKILTLEDISYLSKIEHTDDAVKNCQIQIRHIKDEIERKETYKRKTYQNYMEEIISKEEYVSYSKEFDQDITGLRENLEYLQEELEEKNQMDSEYGEWVKKFRNYIGIAELTREIVLELIEKIEVNADGSINIYYKFRNPHAE